MGAATRLLVAVLAAGTFVGLAQARPSVSPATRAPVGDRTRLNPALRPRMIMSPNWSGYVATAAPGKGVSYQSVTGTWTIPSTVCTRRKIGTYSTIWVGLGGFATTRQEEVGTDANCTKSGKPFYYAWFELVPYLSYPVAIKDKLSAGDIVTGLVRIVNPRLVELQLRDRTRGWTFTTKINWAINDTTTADWIVEAPAECVQIDCSEASLADFRSATMRDISAVGNGMSGTLSDPNWRIIPIRLVPSKLTIPMVNSTAISASHRGLQGEAESPAGATPGKPSANGRSFKWTWVKVASRAV